MRGHGRPDSIVPVSTAAVRIVGLAGPANAPSAFLGALKPQAALTRMAARRSLAMFGEGNDATRVHQNVRAREDGWGDGEGRLEILEGAASAEVIARNRRSS